MSQVSNSSTSATLTTALDSGKKTIITIKSPKETCSDRKASGSVVEAIFGLEVMMDIIISSINAIGFSFLIAAL